MKLIITYIFFIFLSFAVSAQDNYDLLHKANDSYIAENFGQAIEDYDSILSTNYEAAELYYNLGNAYFKDNNLPMSIVNYERALRLAPNDEDIIYNLKHANLFVQDEFVEVPDFFLDKIYNSVLHIFGSNTWALMSINAFILALVIFFVFLFSKIVIRRKFAFFGSILLVLFSVLTLNFSYQTKVAITNPNAAIVMQISTVKSSPEIDGTEIFILNPGVKVGLKSSNDEWYEVKLPNGKVGWIRKDLVEVI